MALTPVLGDERPGRPVDSARMLADLPVPSATPLIPLYELATIRSSGSLQRTPGSHPVRLSDLV